MNLFAGLCVTGLCAVGAAAAGHSPVDLQKSQQVLAAQHARSDALKGRGQLGFTSRKRVVLNPSAERVNQALIVTWTPRKDTQMGDAQPVFFGR